ncbi:hypothetical protein [Sphingosinicella sp. BN140058]|uniref:hypothetical protein n=1 Tax=Sphingosinicella sp. BN140058 TaxID=1892855 RepID=UPI0010103017|nr:hypothetical protein [Sphingosinicella sp. BN140058]QAY78168.1 hypothetical protein ETR14_17760 [Sphingosinicella sp. BN140058]
MNRIAQMFATIWKLFVVLGLLVFCMTSLVWLPYGSRALFVAGVTICVFSALSKRPARYIRFLSSLLGAILIGCADFSAGSACIADPALCTDRANPLQEYFLRGASVTIILFLAFSGAICLEWIALRAQASAKTPDH